MLMVAPSDSHHVKRWSGDTWVAIPLYGHTWSNGRVIGYDQLPVRLYDHLVIAADGTFWLAEHQPRSDSLRYWRIFGADGRLLAFVPLPAGSTVWQVDGDRVLATRVTGAGLEHIEVLELVH
jgi:hypothetical protein